MAGWREFSLLEVAARTDHADHITDNLRITGVADNLPNKTVRSTGTFSAKAVVTL